MKPENPHWQTRLPSLGPEFALNPSMKDESVTIGRACLVSWGSARLWLGCILAFPSQIWTAPPTVWPSTTSLNLGCGSSVQRQPLLLTWVFLQGTGWPGITVGISCSKFLPPTQSKRAEGNKLCLRPSTLWGALLTHGPFSGCCLKGVT